MWTTPSALFLHRQRLAPRGFVLPRFVNVDRHHPAATVALRSTSKNLQECRHSLHLRAKNTSSVGADIQTDVVSGFSLQRGRSHRAPHGSILHCGKIENLVTRHILLAGRFLAPNNEIEMTDAVQGCRSCIYNSRSSKACRMTCGSTSTPVQYFTPITPCCTSIPSPSTVLQPRSLAACSRRVRGGL